VKRVLVTGANGFVGRALCSALAASNYHVRAVLRRAPSNRGAVSEVIAVGDIGAATDWTAALDGVDCVVHLAARAHIANDARANSALYVETNVHGSRRLAEAAARGGVGRMIYLSSVKVNGEESRSNPYTSADPPRPEGIYGMSKWQGEIAVAEVAASAGMQVTIVRSPLVYGPGVRANFLRLLRWVDKEYPLPLGAVDNRRSLVSIWNLCDLLVRLVENPLAAGHTWMVSDAEDLSTPELIRRTARHMGRRVRLLPVPVNLLFFCGRFTGWEAEVSRLTGSLEVDIAPTRRCLGWSPPISVDVALERTIDWYLRDGRSL
jgi:nucleoside-diphosphate-sugar epimerase